LSDDLNFDTAIVATFPIYASLFRQKQAVKKQANRKKTKKHNTSSDITHTYGNRDD